MLVPFAALQLQPLLTFSSFHGQSYINGDSTNSTIPSETILVLLGDKMPKDGVQIKSALVSGKIPESEPQAWQLICGMEMNLIRYMSRVCQNRWPSQGRLVSKKVNRQSLKTHQNHCDRTSSVFSCSIISSSAPCRSPEFSDMENRASSNSMS
jgi:hypothetical protein